LQLYVELNVAHELLPEEAEQLPTKHAAHQVSLCGLVSCICLLSCMQ